MKKPNFQYGLVLGVMIAFTFSTVVTGEDKIIPFHSVNGLIPGLSTYKDAEKKLGAPEKIESSKPETFAPGVEIGGNKLLEYTSKGLFLLISRAQSDNADPQIDAIYVQLPYAGKTPNGLYLGMPRRAALDILEKDYHLSEDLGESLLFAASERERRNFQVWFENDALIRMKLFK